MDTTTTGIPTTAGIPTPSIQDSASALAPISKDLAADIDLIVKTVKALRATGVAGVAPLIPEAVADVRQTIADVNAALPSIKAGYKTTEFWLAAGVTIVISVLEVIGHPLPVSGEIALASVASVYAVVRGLIKK